MNKINHLGYMIDVSRGAAVKVDVLKKLIFILKSFGYDYLMLYMEDMYEIENEPYFGYMRGRYSKEELIELDNYAKSLNIELIPCIQTLAHLERLTMHYTYSDHFEVTNILNVGEDKTYELIEKMFKSLRKEFTTDKIHVGMDEAYLLGRGKYLDKNGIVPTNKIMEEHLAKVSSLAKKYGFEKVYIWGDMTSKEHKINYPDNVTSFLWYYHPLGKEALDKKINDFKCNAPKRVGFAGCATKYVGFAPLNTFSTYSLKEQIEGCFEHNIDEYLVTTWGDGASDSSVFSVLPSIFYASSIAKRGGFNDKEKRLFKKIVGVEYDEFIKVDSLYLLDPSISYENKWNNVSFMLLYNDPLSNLMGDIDDEKYKKLFLESASKLKSLSRNREYGYMFNSLRLLAEAVSLKANIGNEIYKAYQNKEDLTPFINRLKAFLVKFNAFKKAYEKQWLSENKNQGYEVQNIRFGGLIERTKFIIRELQAYSGGKIDKIDELEEKHLVNDLYFRPLEKDTDVVNVYQNIVSGGGLK